MVIVIRNGDKSRVQILDEDIFVSHGVNACSKGVNPTILRPLIGKY